jgi:hypothetical protein
MYHQSLDLWIIVAPIIYNICALNYPYSLQNMLYTKLVEHVRLMGCLGLLSSMFFSFAPWFLAKRFQLHVLISRKKCGVVST